MQTANMYPTTLFPSLACSRALASVACGTCNRKLSVDKFNWIHTAFPFQNHNGYRAIVFEMQWMGVYCPGYSTYFVQISG